MTEAEALKQYKREYAEHLRARIAHEEDPSNPAPTRMPVMPVSIDSLKTELAALESELASLEHCGSDQVQHEASCSDPALPEASRSSD